MTTHSRLSPSSRHRWAACPGSVREEAKYPEQPSGPAAIDGTHSHTLLEFCIRGKLLDPMTMVGQTMSDHDGSFVVDHDRAERVKVAIDYIRSRVELLKADGIEVSLYAEEKVDPKAFFERDDMAGTLDCRIETPDLVEIIDYKDGMAEVPVRDNPQLEMYAFGVLAEEPVEKKPTRETVFTIIQPKLRLKGLNPIQSVTVLTLDLLRKTDTVRAEAAATDQPDAPLIPGDSQCKYCRAKGSCSALARKVMEASGVMFPAITAPASPLDLVEQSASKDPATMDEGQLRQILEAAPLLRQFLDSVNEEALRRMKAGIRVPGFKVVNGRGSRAWNCSDEEMEKKLVQMGIPKGEVYVKKLLSPAQAEKVYWTKRDGTKMQLSKRQIERMDKEYVSHLSGSLTVVPESDSRKEVTFSAAELFTAVPAEVPAVLEDSLPSWLTTN